MRRKTDFLVIGSGIAGLTFALKVAEKGTVTIVTKGSADDTATRYAQGGIAAVMYTPDNYEKHIRDTMIAGDELNNPEIVRITITESTERIKELIDWGTNFDRTSTGKFDLGKEGGHSEFRVLHHKDQTGLEIERALLNKIANNPNITFLEHCFAVELITQHHLGKPVSRRSTDINCLGAYILNTNTGSIDTILARVTMLSTGGAGNVYSSTTNPPVATGDGIAMVYRAKGKVENMEFIQFHPTSLFNPKEKPSFLITEALRGFGAVLRNQAEEAFMEKYDERGSLAPRDIVARSIDTEMKLSGTEHLYLDCRHLDKEGLLSHFPTIYAKCLSIGIDITRDMIPIVPSAHYTCGGIKVDEFARTSIHHLYASGECASTGLHGANRLASNSLLEALVFSHRASLDSASAIGSITYCDDVPDWNAEGMVLNEEMVLITHTLKELQLIMSHYVGIVRSNLRLKRAIDRLRILHRETEELYNKSILTQNICELRNLINTAYLIIKAATERKESRGLHYSIDYPRVSSHVEDKHYED
ncbi:MAG TPA: L-aspartate oxidase [Bacteroidales bacterium]|nr:MAG: L-aspartate oxidase [Bacteroidetes bacterium GWE2_42_24]OFY29936.1 MAG: L-aspartate oxidase [Bacteroidetes bacterium GWF2_43_11]HBZ67878.1 L-aspartate oxidase [Bacteroidales bacterium]